MNRPARALVFPLIFLTSLILAACGAAQVTTSPASAASVKDDFSGAACRFGSLEVGSTKGYGCADGEFRAWIDNGQASYEFVTSPSSDSCGDVRIEVDARIVSAVPNGGAIVLCRGSQASGNFYEFVLSPDGSAGISDYLDGEEQIARTNSLPPGTVKPDWNHMRVECVGNHLAFYVNGTLAVERDIDRLPKGEIGLGAGGSSEGMTDVRFDNLVISVP